MKRFFVLIAFLFAVVIANANPPPGETVKENFITVQADNFDCQHSAVSVQYTLDVAETVPQVINVTHTIGAKEAAVREVTYPRKISLSKAESGVATENAVMAINSTCTENRAFKIPPLLLNAKVVTNKKNFIRNLRHSNYGYPLSARTRFYFS